MKHSGAIILLLVAFNSNVADANNVSDILVRYHDIEGSDKCERVNNATDQVAYLKNAGAPREDIPAIISRDPSLDYS